MIYFCLKKYFDSVKIVVVFCILSCLLIFLLKKKKRKGKSFIGQDVFILDCPKKKKEILTNKIIYLFNFLILLLNLSLFFLLFSRKQETYVDVLT
jgi:hypothetical protein